MISRRSRPIERDDARGRIVEARDETEQRALARAGAADERDDLVRRDREIDLVEHRLLVVVAEADVFEGDRGLCLRDRHRVGRVAHVVLAIEHLEATLRARGRAFHRPGGVGERLERLIKHEQVGAEDESASRA